MAQIDDDTIQCLECSRDLPNDSDSSFHCWECDLFYCPICMKGTEFYTNLADNPFCEHYLASFAGDGYDPDFIDFVRDGKPMEGVASEEDLERHDTWEWELLEKASQKMAELSVEEKVKHFGSLHPLWSGGSISRRFSYMEETCNIR